MTQRTLKKILFVDDEDDIRTVAKVALEAIGGMTVETCNRGQKALECIGEFGPDLVLLDVMMPEMDGPTTFQKLREIPEGADVPIMFLTAKTQTEEVSKLRDLGALAVLTKPFDPMKLSEEIQAVWDKHNA